MTTPRSGWTATLLVAAVLVALLVPSSLALAKERDERPIFNEIQISEVAVNSSRTETYITCEIEIFAYAGIGDDGDPVPFQPRRQALEILSNNDTDGDGKISFGEFEGIEGIDEVNFGRRAVTLRGQTLRDFFSMLDTNRDNSLDANEVSRFQLGEGSEIDEFERLREPLALTVTLAPQWAPNRPVDIARVRVDAETQRGEVRFRGARNHGRAGQAWQRIVPGEYIIDAKFDIAAQPARTKINVWEDALIQLPDGTLFFLRTSPDDLRPNISVQGAVPTFPKMGLSDSATVAIGEYDNNRDEYAWVNLTKFRRLHDTLAFYRRFQEGYQERITMYENLINQNPNDYRYEAGKYKVELKVDLLRPELDEGRAEREFDDMVEQVREITRYIDWWQYNRKLEYREIRDEIDRLFLDIWKKSWLCMPGYEPDGTYDDGTDRSLEQERERWFRNPQHNEDGTGGSATRLQFLSCPDDVAECKGLWNREVWLGWLGAVSNNDAADGHLTSYRWPERDRAATGSWIAQVYEVQDKTHRLYGLKNGEFESGAPVADDEGGRIITMIGNDRWQSNLWVPIWEPAYKLAIDCVQTLKKLAMSYANRLALSHAESEETVSYVFTAKDDRGRTVHDTEDPDGRVTHATMYYRTLDSNTDRFARDLRLHILDTDSVKPSPRDVLTPPSEDETWEPDMPDDIPGGGGTRPGD